MIVHVMPNKNNYMILLRYGPKSRAKKGGWEGQWEKFPRAAKVVTFLSAKMFKYVRLIGAPMKVGTALTVLLNKSFVKKIY